MSSDHDISHAQFFTCVRVKGAKGVYHETCLKGGLIGVGFDDGLGKDSVQKVGDFRYVRNVATTADAKQQIEAMQESEKQLTAMLSRNLEATPPWNPTDDELALVVKDLSARHQDKRKALAGKSRDEQIRIITDYRKNQVPFTAAPSAFYANLRAGDWVVLLQTGETKNAQRGITKEMAEWSSVRALGRLSEGDLNLTPEVEGELKRFGAEVHVFRKVEWLVKEADEARKLLQANAYPPPNNAKAISLIIRGRKTNVERPSKVTPSGLNRLLIPSNGDAAPTPAANSRINNPHNPDHWLVALLSQPHAPRCLILEGVPGTTKTHALAKFREIPAATEKYGAVGDGPFAITLHPATAYEDFVEGLRPSQANRQTSDSTENTSDSKENEVTTGRWHGDEWQLVKIARPFYQSVTDFHDKTACPATFTVRDGFFLTCCSEAVREPEKRFIVLLDEINRCNIPKVFGDLLTTIEASKRATWVKEKRAWALNQTVTLPYSGRTFFVPENLIVIGTMNTTDRSVAPMDAALRRRFAFIRMWPYGFAPEGAGPNSVEEILKELQVDATVIPWMKPSVELWLNINTRLHDFGDDALLGHSYLYALKAELDASKTSDQRKTAVLFHWNHYIFPQLVDIIQSNDLESSVFGQSTSTEGKLHEGLVIPSQEVKAGLISKKVGLFSTQPKHFEGQWTRRGDGMLRTLTLRLSNVM